MIEEKRNELFDVYRKWEKELKGKCPELINKQYSHPYYLHIPDKWYQSTYRILIVGEEGHGEKTFNLPIEEAQEFKARATKLTAKTTKLIFLTYFFISLTIQ